MRVRAGFFVTVEVDVEDYAKFVAPHDPTPSAEKVQSWLSQNYFDRIDSGIEVGDRPESLTWTNDTVVNIDEVEALVARDWALSDHIHGNGPFRDFVRQQEARQADFVRQQEARQADFVRQQEARQADFVRQQEAHRALDEIGRIGQEQDAAQQARGYRDFL